MWIWILIAFVVGGAILGALSDDGKGNGCLGGALVGLFEVTIYDVAANHFLSHTEGKRVRDHADYGETLKL